MLRSCMVGVVLTAATAVAQERVRVAIHPLTAVGVDDPMLVKELSLETEMILAETKRLILVSPEGIAKALVDEPGGKCPARGKERMDCLERLAHATRAIYAIAVQVKRLGKEYELSASIAAADRVPLNQCSTLTLRDEGAVKVNVALKHQLRMLLLDQMKAGELPVDPRMRDPLPAIPPPPVVPPTTGPTDPPPVVEQPGTKPLKVVGYAAAALGAAGVVTGVALLGAGAGVGSGTKNPETGYVLADRVDDFSRARTMQTAGGAALTAGAAVAAVGLILIFMPGDDDKQVGITPVAGGAVVGFSGRLP